MEIRDVVRNFMVAKVNVRLWKLGLDYDLNMNCGFMQENTEDRGERCWSFTFFWFYCWNLFHPLEDLRYQNDENSHEKIWKCKDNTQVN